MEIVRLGEGVDRTGRLAPEAIERTRRGAARLRRGDRRAGRRPGPDVRHHRHPRRRERRRLPRHGARRRSASTPRWSPATRRPGCRSPARCAAWPPSRRTWSSTSAAARPSSSSATPTVEQRDLGRHRLRPDDRAAPARRPADRRREVAAAEADITAAVDRALAAVPGRDARDAGRAGRLGHDGAALALGLPEYDADAHPPRPDRRYDDVAKVTADLLAATVARAAARCR